MKKITFVAAFLTIMLLLSSKSFAVELTYKGDAYCQCSDGSSYYMGPAFNVGDVTGWNTGTRTHDGGPQIAIVAMGSNIFVIPFGGCGC